MAKTKNPLACDVCEFVAKNKGGLMTHKRRHAVPSVSHVAQVEGFHRHTTQSEDGRDVVREHPTV